MISYIKQKNEYDCGPLVAQIVLEYFEMTTSFAFDFWTIINFVAPSIVSCSR